MSIVRQGLRLPGAALGRLAGGPGKARETRARAAERRQANPGIHPLAW